ncbi:glutamate receptor, ionotropic kainate 2 [Plakobranchus ocellatus]|uniref:Glutamate receptor, ionotropic kainate 2 n=1 Tax=Plakobranchus ocellatus TaxID=259542 RepID=A0AAV4BBL0_9GAST|nr:glutamate receptor, ionotropic kainate 2 [Plakobranchus ocellatus]
MRRHWYFLRTVIFIVLAVQPMVLSWHVQNSAESKFVSYSFERSDYLRNTSGYVPSPSETNLDNTTLIRKTLYRTQKWARLFLEVREVIDYMYNLHKPNESSILIKAETLLLIYTAEISAVVHKIGKSRMFPNKLTKTIAFEVDILCARLEVLEILENALDMEMDITGVIVASSYADFVSLVLDTVATDSAFKWRRFLHITEWIALLVDPPSSSTDFTLFRQIRLPDFVTLVFFREVKGVVELNIKQKTRTTAMGSGPQLCLILTSTPLDKYPVIDLLNSSNQTLQLTLNQTALSNHNLRQNAALYLATKKSVMADMIIPVVFLLSELDKNAFLVFEGTKTTWHGFNIDILSLLSKALGFIGLPFAVTDDGFYAEYEPDGDVLGIVGYIRRREAGLTTMAVSLSERRRKYVDFLYPSIREMQMCVMYKVEKHRSQLGDLHSELAQSNSEILFLLIGPCVALVTGLVVFLGTGVLVNRKNILGRENLKNLYDFPFHWVFQTTELYIHHSSRILRASWCLFCIILFASYGALMTSNAAAPVERPVISSLKDLLAHPEIAIGISPSSSKTMAALSTAEPETTSGQLWQKLIRLNQSDERTFSPDKGYHIKRVLQGRYAFIGGVHRSMLRSFVDELANIRDVRFFDMNSQQLHMALPHNAFYKAELERVTQLASQSGLIQSIYNRWFPSEDKLAKSDVENKTVIDLVRLRLLLLVASPQESDLRLSGHPSGRSAGGGTRTRDRRVPAELRADSLVTVSTTSPYPEVP